LNIRMFKKVIDTDFSDYEVDYQFV
jgi:hypothetical protein